MSRETRLTKRAFLRKATATAGLAAGVGLASEPAAAGCMIDTLTTDETSDTQCFTQYHDGFATHTEVQLTIDGTPNTEWAFRANNSTADSDLCGSAWDYEKTVTTDSETISIYQPDPYYGVEVDKNGDDLTYDLKLYYCA